MNHNDYLVHWGIKGMKWGVRRYQNKDGTLTPAGKKRYDRDVAENNAKKKDNRINIDPAKPDVNRWVKEDLKRARNVSDSTSQVVREAQNLERLSRSNKKNRNRMDLSSMTDKELRERINRELLERQYNDVFNTQKQSRGREYVQNVLSTATTVLGATSSVIGVALAIKELKG